MRKGRTARVGRSSVPQLAGRAAALRPELLISRPDALMAVLKALRAPGAPRFAGLRAVLTVGTVLEGVALWLLGVFS